MNKQNINLIVKQEDLIKDKVEIVFEGAGQLNTLNGVEIFYQEKNGSMFRLKLSNDQGFLIRKAEALTHIKFSIDKIKQCKVSTTFGNLYMDVKTLKIKLDTNKIFLYYELLDGEKIIGKFKLRLEWENESN